MKKLILLIICISIFLPLNSYSAELLFHPTWKVGQEFRLCTWGITHKSDEGMSQEQINNVLNWTKNPRAGQEIFLFRVENIVQVDEKKCYQIYMEQEHYKNSRTPIKCNRFWFTTDTYELIQIEYYEKNNKTKKRITRPLYPGEVSKRGPIKYKFPPPVDLGCDAIPLNIIPDFKSSYIKEIEKMIDCKQKIEYDKNKKCYKVSFGRSLNRIEKIQYWYPGDPWFRTCEYIACNGEVRGAIDLVTPDWKFEGNYVVERNIRVVRD